MITLKYDGSFEGLLTCVFTVFENKYSDVDIRKSDICQASLWGTELEIETYPTKANRVLQGLEKSVGDKGINLLYRSFLSEQYDVENDILYAIQKIYSDSPLIIKDYSDKRILQLAQLVKMVNREKHRMEAFVRFRLTKDNIYFASIEPDFDVLPLIRKHFKSRYADQKWMIYDLKRGYGIYYDLNQVEVIELSFDSRFDPTKTTKDYFAIEELDFQYLWKEYFDSTNIASRKNTQLHVRHVPKRYWKYLSEKQPKPID